MIACPPSESAILLSVTRRVQRPFRLFPSLARAGRRRLGNNNSDIRRLRPCLEFDTADIPSAETA